MEFEHKKRSTTAHRRQADVANNFADIEMRSQQS